MWEPVFSLRCGSYGLHSNQKERALPRTSSLAMVCSHDALQALLPQVRLIQSKDGTVPSRQVLEACALSGQPQVARHGGSGWASRAVLRRRMTAPQKAVKSDRLQAQIILVWDAPGTHLSSDVCLTAKRRDIRVVFIAAKMTWKLQTLDTDVAARSKIIFGIWNSQRERNHRRCCCSLYHV